MHIPFTEIQTSCKQDFAHRDQPFVVICNFKAVISPFVPRKSSKERSRYEEQTGRCYEWRITERRTLKVHRMVSFREYLEAADSQRIGLEHCIQHPCPRVEESGYKSGTPEINACGDYAPYTNHFGFYTAPRGGRKTHPHRAKCVGWVVHLV